MISDDIAIKVPPYYLLIIKMLQQQRHAGRIAGIQITWM
jgi:hypothetical protein